MSLLMTDANGVGGLAIARSLGKQGIEVTASSANKEAICFHSKYVRNKLIYPDIYMGPGAKKNFLNWLTKALKTGGYDVFFPIDESILLTVAENIGELSKHAKIPIPSLDLLNLLTDKSKLLKFAIESNISVPKTYFSEDLKYFRDEDFQLVAQELGLPVIIKPHIGSAAKGQVLVFEAKEIGKRFKQQVRAFGPCMIQEFIQGQKYHMASILNFKSKLRSVCIQKTLRQLPPYGGGMVYGETVENKDILDSGLKLLRNLNYTSISEIEFIVDPRDKKVKLLDFNPRFYGSVCLPIAAGVDFPYLLYKLALDGDIKPDLNYRSGVRCRNLYGDFKHMLTILKHGQAENYSFSRSQTIVNFLKFHRDNEYYDWSLDDPKPFLSLPVNLVKKRVRK